MRGDEGRGREGSLYALPLHTILTEITDVHTCMHTCVHVHTYAHINTALSQFTCNTLKDYIAVN